MNQFHGIFWGVYFPFSEMKASQICGKCSKNFVKLIYLISRVFLIMNFFFRVDDERLSRIAKLEKLRRGEERLHEDHDENVLEDHNPKPVHPGATALPESAESSVEGSWS